MTTYPWVTMRPFKHCCNSVDIKLNGNSQAMEYSKDIDWIVDALIDLNTYCEREGLEEVSDHLVQAIESVAPILRSQPIARSRIQPTTEQVKILEVLAERG